MKVLCLVVAFAVVAVAFRPTPTGFEDGPEGLRHHTPEDEEEEFPKEMPRTGQESDDVSCTNGVCQPLEPFIKEFASILKPENPTASTSVLVGTVLYSGDHVMGWDQLVRHFRSIGINAELVAYSSYEKLISAGFHGQHHIAVHSALSFIGAKRIATSFGFKVKMMAVGNRDANVTSVCLVREDSSISAPENIKGHTVAVAAADSVRGTLVPLHDLCDRSNLQPGVDFTVKRHDVDLGLHGMGDAGEEAAVASFTNGEADVVCVSDRTYNKHRTGSLAKTRVLSTSPLYDASVVTYLDAHEFNLAQTLRSFRKSLLALHTMEDEASRKALAGVGQESFLNCKGRESQYDFPAQAALRFRYHEKWLESQGANTRLPVSMDDTQYNFGSPNMEAPHAHLDEDGFPVEMDRQPFTFGDMEAANIDANAGGDGSGEEIPTFDMDALRHHFAQVDEDLPYAEEPDPSDYFEFDADDFGQAS